MADDWDLHAVVRGCGATATSSSTTTTTTRGAAPATGCFMLDFHPKPCFSPFGKAEACQGQIFPLPDPLESRNAVEELHELYKPFFPKSQPLSPQKMSMPLSSFSSLVAAKDESQMKEHQQPKQSQAQAGSLVSAAATAATTSNPTTVNSSHTSRSKRRKNQQKRVCQVPAEGLSSDVWAWRKYGQKPIKGSPYPRGYYRCSSSKGCLARKQVERNRSDPAMFIVTYTAEHNHPAPTHRNSLAGSTRQKPFTPQTAATNTTDTSKPSVAKSTTSSSTATSMEEELATPSTKVESREDVLEDEEGDDFGISDMVMSDDFFEGLEGLAGPVTGDCFSDHFPANFGLPWIANSAATAAGGI